MLKESATKDVPGAPKRGRPPDAETTSDEDDVPIKRRRRPPPREEEVVAQYRSIVPKQQSSGVVPVRKAVQVLNGKPRFFQDLKENRVLKMALMQVDFGELERRCRCTNEGLISVIDFIQFLMDVDAKEAARVFRRVMEKAVSGLDAALRKECSHHALTSFGVRFHTFTGPTQRQTHVGSLVTFIRLIPHFPKKLRKFFDQKQAELTARILSGDRSILPTLHAAIDAARDETTVTSTTTTPKPRTSLLRNS